MKKPPEHAVGNDAMVTDPHAPWHALSTEEVTELLGSGVHGLSSHDASARLERFGRNELKTTPPVHLVRILLDEFRSPLILILMGSALLLFVVAAVGSSTEHNVDAVLILAIVVINAILGFIQNLRAHRGIEALKRLAAPNSTFLRDGRRMTADASLVVPGDVVYLEEGDRIPADGRILEAYDLQVDESALTGESLTVTKTSQSLPEDTNLAERANMTYSGTVVMGGRGRFVVTETGMSTQVGLIAEEIQTAKEGPTHFQRQVGELGKRITIIISALIGIIVILQASISSLSLLEVFVTAVALAVAAIPEGLPVVLTLALAFGTRRMLERNCLVRALPVVEILGSSQVICSDKTGTITEGQMGLRILYWHGNSLEVTGGSTDPNGEFLDQGRATRQKYNLALLAGALCNNAQYDSQSGFQGDPTEVALLAGSHKAGINVDDYVRVDEIPFSSQRKMMSVLVQHDRHGFVFSKGAPEVIINRCDKVHTPEGSVELNNEHKRHLLEVNDQLASQALRVIALAYKENAASDHGAAEQNLVFLGLAGLSDPPREAAKQAIAAAFQAGIRVVMITGDNRTTATAIARDVGLGGECLEGRDLEGLDETELKETVQRVNLYARAEPKHKVRILQTLQAADQVVAMTGDGVNDAPALKGADVGIAMGIRGTEVARDASDMVLLDDNFATIVAAIEEGRRIFANIKKFVNYLLIGNFAEALTVLLASFFGVLPVTAVQILWINLVTDGIPAVALGMDPAAPGLMRQPPRKGEVLGRSMFASIVAIGVIQTVIILSSFYLALNFDLTTARTVAFTAFPLQEYAVLGMLRYREGAPLLSNRWLAVAVAVSLGLQLLIVYSPLASFFGVVSLGLIPWVILMVGLGLGYVAAIWIAQFVVRRLGPI